MFRYELKMNIIGFCGCKIQSINQKGLRAV